MVHWVLAMVNRISKNMASCWPVLKKTAAMDPSSVIRASVPCFGLHPIWVNYNISLTWIKAIWGWFPILTIIPVRSQWGRYNLPRSYLFLSMTSLQLRGCRWGWQELHAPGESHMRIWSYWRHWTLWFLGLSLLPYGHGTNCVRIYLLQNVAGLIWFNMVWYGLIYIYI